jgi:hypothetical protein
MAFQTDALIGRVTVFAGAGKGCGKTAAFLAAAAMAQGRGPAALFTIGLAAPPVPPARAAEAPVLLKGDIVMTTVPLARAAEAGLEVIDALPGRSAIGRLCVCRALRAGRAAMVGPEHLGQLAQAIDTVRRENLAESVLVDGAAGRLTQAGALPEAQVVYCAKADGTNFLRVAEDIELLSRLADLPVEDVGESSESSESGGRGANGAGAAPRSLRLEGPLTASVIEGLGAETAHVSIGSLGDCFLDAPTFNRAARRLKITVRRRIPLLCFAIALKDVSRGAFLSAAPSAAGRAEFGVHWP